MKLSHPCLSNIMRSCLFYNQLPKCSVIHFPQPSITILFQFPGVYILTSYRIQINLRIYCVKKYTLNMAPPVNTKNIMFVFVIILTNCKIKTNSSELIQSLVIWRLNRISSFNLYYNNYIILIRL